MDLEQNILVVNTGDKLVMFDSGAGTNAAFGVKAFGARVGRAIPNLRAAGLDPAQIDIVALTHTHPDHYWGLVDDSGRMLYPNARIAVGDIDLNYWCNLSKPQPFEMSDPMRDHFLGAHKNIAPYLDAGRVIRLLDNDVVTPGITAHLRPGHSPGHLLYRVGSDGAFLTVWGDICHHWALLLAHPEWGFVFDFNQKTAAQTRKQVFEEVIGARSAVLAYHFPFPGRGHLQRVDDRLQWIASPLELS